MRNLEEQAIESFFAGLNCAQSVVTTYSELLNFDKELAMNLSTGFGAGMGRLQGTCGAVTGAFMVIGLYNSNKQVSIAEKKELSYSMIQEFNKRFLQKHHSTDCRHLLNCDLNTDEGHLQFQANNLKETVCKVCIRDSVDIVNELLKPL